MRARYRSKPEAKQRRAEYNSTPEYKRRHAGYHIKAKYGLTIEARAAMLTAQNNLCPACGEKFRNDKDAHIDHCHRTGNVRALLHGNCNRVLGIMNENPSKLDRLAAYARWCLAQSEDKAA